MANLKGRQLVGRLRLPSIPAVNLRPLNSFYKPQVAPVVSAAMKELTQSLGNLVPTLQQYERVEDKVEEVKQKLRPVIVKPRNKQSAVRLILKV